MPRNGSGVYSAPAGTLATTQTTIESSKYNAFVNDLVNDLNGARPITAGGTGSTTASAARTALGLEIGTDVQAYSDELDKVGVEATSIASASSIDLGAATGLYVNITGTTTITQLGTADAGIFRLVRFQSGLTLTHNGSVTPVLLLPGNANIAAAAGDTALFASDGSGNWRCLAYQRRDGTPLALIDEDTMSSNSAVKVPSQQSVKAYVDAHGLVQRTFASTADASALTATIPGDDTIPQITEGSQVIASSSFTPTSATNRLRIRFSGQVAASTNVPVVVALFDGNTSAIQARIVSVTTGNAKVLCDLDHEMVAGSTSARTFSVRAGPTSAATIRFNGEPTAGRLLGGASFTTLTVEEVKV